MKLLFITLY